MKKHNYLRLVATILSYVASLFFFLAKERTLGIIWLCLGTCDLCNVITNKIKKDKKEK